jgi:hypothetical protein
VKLRKNPEPPKKTETKMKTLFPAYEETFTYDGLRRTADELCFEVWDYDAVGDHDLMCYCVVKLADLDLGSSALSKQLLKPDTVTPASNKGAKCLLELKFDVVESGDGHEGSFVDVTVASAGKLPSADLGGSADPYVTISKNATVKRTVAVKNTLNPFWDQHFHFPGEAEPGDYISFEVWDYDAIGDDDIMCEGVLQLDDLKVGKHKPKKLQLYKPRDKHGELGKELVDKNGEPACLLLNIEVKEVSTVAAEDLPGRRISSNSSKGPTLKVQAKAVQASNRFAAKEKIGGADLLLHPRVVHFSDRIIELLRTPLYAIPYEKRQELLRIWKLFDDDDSGTIEPNEIRKVLQAIDGENVAEDDPKLLALVKTLDADHSGEINVDDFNAIMNLLHVREQKIAFEHHTPQMLSGAVIGTLYEMIELVPKKKLAKPGLSSQTVKDKNGKIVAKVGGRCMHMDLVYTSTPAPALPLPYALPPTPCPLPPTPCPLPPTPYPLPPTPYPLPPTHLAPSRNPISVP